MIRHASSSINVSRRKAAFAEVIGISNPDWRSFLFLVLFLSTLGWMSDTVFMGFQAAVGNVPSPGWSYILLGISPFFLVTGWGWLRWKSARRRKVQLRASSRDVEPHAGIILFLSNILNKQHLEMLKSGNNAVLEAERFSWKPCHLGMEKHRGMLRKVWVICSPESSSQFKWFTQLFEPLFSSVDFEQAGGEDGVAFEDVGALVETIEGVLHGLPADMDESDVIIDITGGQKPASVAGMMVSLVDEGREIQYVQTNEPHAVKTYAYHISTIGRQIRALT